MSTTPPYAPLWAGIRPKLKDMIEHHAAAVYLYLLSRLDVRTGRCDPSTEGIAEDLGIDTRTVTRAKDALKALGTLDWIRSPGKRDKFIFPVLDIRDQGGTRHAGGASHAGGTPDEGTSK